MNPHLLSYFGRRLLLVGFSFFGIMVVTFLFTELVPGGPVEQYLAQFKGGAGGEGGARGEVMKVSPRLLESLNKIYRRDKPMPVRFGMWLWHDRLGMRAQPVKFPNKTVWQVISERFPISLSFGIPSLVLTYLVCVPLGIAKALRNGKPFDLATSFIVFTLYALPAFALGMVLKMLFCGTVEGFWDIFPLGGYRSEDWMELTAWGRFTDRLWHLALPLACYVIGNFAVMTLLMKNSLLEQISQDYVRTVLAKGATLRRAVWGHALRNALIPLATGIGGILTVMFAGSVLIERVFDIPGMGWMSLEAITGRDYPLFLGIVCLQSILGLLGRVLSDFCYVLIDPRIHFGGNR